MFGAGKETFFCLRAKLFSNLFIIVQQDEVLFLGDGGSKVMVGFHTTLSDKV